MATVVPQRRTGLLDRYRPGVSSLLAFPTGALLADGIRAVVPGTGHGWRAGIAERSRRALAEAVRDGAPPYLVGALPFRDDAEAWLVVPAAIAAGPPLQEWTDDQAERALHGEPCATAAPPPEAYARRVAGALASLAPSGAVEKVVLARALDLRGAEPDVRAILGRLAASDPWGNHFAVALPPGGDGERTLVGSSPETLVRRTGRTVESLPLAGSAARHHDPVEDARRAAALMDSEKDRREHAVVVRAVADALAPLCDRLEVPPGPTLVRTSAMWHLATRVRGRLADPRTTSLALVAALHPTPAVCGRPAGEARVLIDRREGADRGFYSGAVGWEDATGDGEWAVAIRCGEVEGDHIRLWAGAGVVAGSDPRAELSETTAKFGTLLAALGVSGRI